MAAKRRAVSSKIALFSPVKALFLFAPKRLRENGLPATTRFCNAGSKLYGFTPLSQRGHNVS
eukprot:4858531-Prymnesium_polylepis.1